MVVEITVVQFKQLRTTTPRKKRNELTHLYIEKVQQKFFHEELHNGISQIFLMNGVPWH